VLIAELRRRLGSLALDVRLEAPPGETLVLVGENGAGKSTILNLLAGLLDPDEGRIELDGAVYYDAAAGVCVPAYERAIGYVFQDYALFPHLSVAENVAFGLRAAGTARAAARDRAGAALARVGLTALAGRTPGELSGGQRQRVALARALVLEPRLLLLDEPLSALDPQTRREVRAELRHALRGLACATVLVTHDPFEALVFGREIAVVEQGRLAQVGSRDDLLRQPRSRYVAELLGLNLFTGRVAARAPDGLAEIATADGGRLHVVLDERGADGQEVLVAVDPREITLHPAPPSGTAQNVFAGTVAQLVPEPPFGERVRAVLDTTPPLVAEVTAHAVQQLGLREGTPVHASFKAVAARAYAA